MSLEGDIQGLFTTVDTRITNKQTEHSVRRVDVSQSLKDAVNLLNPDNFIAIHDTEDPFNPNGILVYFKNFGDGILFYNLVSGGPNYPIAPNGVYGFAYGADPNQVPLIIFDPSYVYAIYSDIIPQADAAFLTSIDAAALIAMFNSAFAQNYMVQNGNGNINVLVKNFVLDVIDSGSGIAGQVTELQILDASDGDAVVYSAPLPFPGDFQYSDANLLPDHNYKVVMTSSNPNIQVSVNGGNTTSTIIKQQNFAEGDADNNFTVPLRISISQSQL